MNITEASKNHYLTEIDKEINIIRGGLGDHYSCETLRDILRKLYSISTITARDYFKRSATIKKRKLFHNVNEFIEKADIPQD